jgi:nucleotide-binding universal stress UspA family protein
MKKSKANPLNPPLEDLQGQVYQHELGDPDIEEQIDRKLDEWGRRASKKKHPPEKKGPPLLLPQRTGTTGPLLQTHKHLLIAVDGSEVSKRALAYVGELMGGRQDIRVLILHAARPAPPKLLEFGGSENPEEEKAGEVALQGARTDWIEREDRAAARMFAHARATLRKAGVPEDVVDTETVPWDPHESLDTAILEVAHEKHCGTVVVGYAAFSWLQEHLHSHLAESLLQKAAGIAIWIVH